MEERRIEIVSYDPGWPGAFEAERARLRAALKALALRIDHHGSTSVPGLAAKPVIDIQVSVAALQPFSAYGDRLAALGYHHVAHPDDSFCPFFHRPIDWPHTHHVHVVESHGREERRTLAFRDYLREHREAAREYEVLKRVLAGQVATTDRDSQERYAAAKTDFIERIVAVAISEGYPRAGNLVHVNGVTLYYEVHGHGDPLLLIHGGTLTADSWRPYIAAFAEHYQVITPDTRAHGRSHDSPGVMSYRLLADDMAAFVKALDLRKPLIVGYSDGGQTALEIGMNYPELPRALVAGGAMAEFTASYRAWVRDAVGDDHSPVDLERFQLNHPDWVGWLQEIYGPERWKALLARLKPMWVTPLNYTQTDLARIVAPTLLVIGDRDELVPVQEAARMYGLMRTAELAVVPGASHGAFFSRNVTAFQTLILDFLQRHG